MKILMTHRKCMVCGNTSTDLNRDKCSCGCYMYMIGQVAVPYQQSEKKLQEDKAS